MMLWAKAHAVWLVLVLTMLMAVTVRLNPELTVVIPSFLTGRLVPVPFGYLVGFLPSLVWLVARLRARTPLESVSTRLTRLASLEIATNAATAAVFGVIVATEAGPVLVGAARNAAFGSCIVLLALGVLPPTMAFVVPIFCLLVCTFFGFPGEPSRPATWAILVRPWSFDQALFIAVFAAAGISAYALTHALGPNRRR